MWTFYKKKNSRTSQKAEGGSNAVPFMRFGWWVSLFAFTHLSLVRCLPPDSDSFLLVFPRHFGLSGGVRGSIFALSTALVTMASPVHGITPTLSFFFRRTCMKNKQKRKSVTPISWPPVSFPHSYVLHFFFFLPSGLGWSHRSHGKKLQKTTFTQ